ncbi:MAG: apolipoprotein N-acyltransferase, partial [Nitrospinota bacterium]
SALAWVALIPLFFSIEKSSGKASLKYGFTTGFGFFLGLIYWVINTMKDYGGLPVSVSIVLLLVLSSYLGLYFGIFSLLLSCIKKGGALFKWIVAPFIWTALEYARGHLFTGFPWGLLGYSQYETLALVQIADITGVYGVSFLIVLVNGCLFSLLKFSFGNKKWDAPSLEKKPVFCLVAVTVFATGATIFYGKSALSKYDTPAGKKVRVALVQGNIDQSVKWDRSYREKTLDLYESLTLTAVEGKTDLVIWPETAAPFFFQEPGLDRKRITDLARMVKTPILIGSPAYEMRGEKQFDSYNRAYLLDGSGNVSGHYDKMHLVPFGEFVPLKSILTFVDKLVEGIGDFSHGLVHKVFELKEASFSALICYEIIFPDLVRNFVKNGADFLVHITNDAWFGKSNAPYQHFAIVTLRAIENRVPVVRAANTGVTGIISATGEVKKKSKIFTAEHVTGTVQLVKKEKTLYTMFGDFFAVFCCVISSIALAFTTFSRKKWMKM